MTSSDLIKIFDDTQNTILNTPALFDQMVRSQLSSQLFLDGYTSPLRIAKEPNIIEIVENTTFSMRTNAVTAVLQDRRTEFCKSS